VNNVIGDKGCNKRRRKKWKFIDDESVLKHLPHNETSWSFEKATSSVMKVLSPF